MSGILLIDKPQGWTSNDVCQFVKKRFRFKKAGHGGTLDPFATGLLVLYLDEATRLAGTSLSDEKVYEGVIHLGLDTRTGDPEGEVLSRREVPDEISRDFLQNICDSFLGLGRQKPPMTSAIKKGGIPLYRLARKGIEVEREPREIEIFELTVQKWIKPFIHFRARVSKGTYLRVLAQDLGMKMGIGASLSQLRRVASGRYHIDGALSVEQLKKMNSKEELEAHRLNTLVPQGLRSC